MKINVEEAWEINRILVGLQADSKTYDGFCLYIEPQHYDKYVHGICAHGSFEMTLEQTKQLIKDLQKEVERYEHLEEEAKNIAPVPDYDEYFDEYDWETSDE